jgi:hypothetical protein
MARLAKEVRNTYAEQMANSKIFVKQNRHASRYAQTFALSAALRVLCAKQQCPARRKLIQYLVRAEGAEITENAEAWGAN